jgi:hypothetical protein
VRLIMQQVDARELGSSPLPSPAGPSRMMT